MHRTLVCTMFAALSLSQAKAAVITFDSLAMNGLSPVQNSYQPLLDGYAGDGGALGITIDWGGAMSVSNVWSSMVVDHTPGSNGSGGVLFDGGQASYTIAFSAPVIIASFYFSSFYAGTFHLEDRGYALSGDAAPVIDLLGVDYESQSYSWQEQTGFATTPIEALTISGDGFKQLDDLTVYAAGSMPVSEPGSLAVIGAALLGLATFRQRAHRA